MNPTENKDKLLEQLLRDEAYDAPQNEWFTPRVLNRLPQRHSPWRWVPFALYAIAAVMCLACWLYLIGTQDFNVITVRDITQFVGIAAVTAVVIWQAIASMVRQIN